MPLFKVACKYIKNKKSRHPESKIYPIPKKTREIRKHNGSQSEMVIPARQNYAMKAKWKVNQMQREISLRPDMKM